MQIGEEGKKNFLEKLKWDMEFLAQLKIMDCSLLLGIHNVDQAEQEKVEVEEWVEDEECEDNGMSSHPLCSYGTPPDSPAASSASLGSLVLENLIPLLKFMP